MKSFVASPCIQVVASSSNGQNGLKYGLLLWRVDRKWRDGPEEGVAVVPGGPVAGGHGLELAQRAEPAVAAEEGEEPAVERGEGPLQLQLRVAPLAQRGVHHT